MDLISSGLKLHGVVLGLGFALLVVACDSPDADGEDSTEDAIKGGGIVAQSNHPEVGALHVGPQVYAATLIGRRTVVTAAHVIGSANCSNREGCAGPLMFWTDGNRDIPIRRFRSFGKPFVYPLKDVAVLELAAQPTGIPAAGIGSPPAAGRPVSFWGYGAPHRGEKQKVVFKWGPARIGEVGDSGGAYLNESGEIFAVLSDERHTTDSHNGEDTYSLLAAVEDDVNATMGSWGAR